VIPGLSVVTLLGQSTTYASSLGLTPCAGVTVIMYGPIEQRDNLQTIVAGRRHEANKRGERWQQEGGEVGRIGGWQHADSMLKGIMGT
jgi:hypothetical protein